MAECGFFFREFLLWEFLRASALEHHLYLQGANVHKSSKGGASREALSSPEEPWYIPVVEIEILQR